MISFIIEIINADDKTHTIVAAMFIDLLIDKFLYCFLLSFW